MVGDLPTDHRLFRDELFVPFVAVAQVDSIDEALKLASSTEYGLTAGSTPRTRPRWSTQFLSRIEAGVVYVNRKAGATTGAWPGVQPFGGWKGVGQLRQGRPAASTTSSSSMREQSPDGDLLAERGKPGRRGWTRPGGAGRPHRHAGAGGPPGAAGAGRGRDQPVPAPGVRDGARRGGAVIEDVDGNLFLDFNAGIAVCSTGHAHPRVVEAVGRQAADLLHYSASDFYLPIYSEYAQALAATAPMTKAGAGLLDQLGHRGRGGGAQAGPGGHRPRGT